MVACLGSKHAWGCVGSWPCHASTSTCWVAYSPPLAEVLSDVPQLRVTSVQVIDQAVLLLGHVGEAMLQADEARARVVGVPDQVVPVLMSASEPLHVLAQL